MKIELIFNRKDEVDYKRLRLFEEATACLSHYNAGLKPYDSLYSYVCKRLIGIKVKGVKCWIEFTI